MKIACYLINLDDNTARLDTVGARFHAQGIAFERVSATDGRKRGADTFPQYDAHGALSFYARPLLGAEVACSLSHIEALTRFSQSDADIAVIFEDDVLLKPDFIQSMQDILHLLSQGFPEWQLLHLNPKSLKHCTKIGRAGQHDVYAAHDFSVGTAAIAYTKSGAAATLAGATPIFAPWDVYLKDLISRTGTGAAVMPRLVEATGADSEIAHKGQRKSLQVKGFTGWWRKQMRIVTHKLRARRQEARFRRR
ncbi:glycosyl transferase, family 25 [Ketogulonicigenium robustum]|uniref:Glycosyl transferase, family 25 n=1 Tax=Ketogulonicigenium robustum TaxID=92947 RepID=A0A1W6P2B4_9RHOB|nr:glycosyltransferase family 25 protein [Ketogulonicigenium robustum]ARO15569.1 glycosyl transferase, family 25 [Ketogulonicigenium robustum]